MLHVIRFTFNPFQENTYVLHNGEQAVIIDPGCYDAAEQKELEQALVRADLQVVRCINTHAHLDHVFGNAWVHRTYAVLPELHTADLPILHAADRMAKMYGVHMEPSPEPVAFLNEGDVLELGEERLELFHVPGHAPGHVVLYCRGQRILIGGDVLFQGSIGRTDLPGGDHDLLIRSIREKLLELPDDVRVYCGHGPETTIGIERRTNPFLQ